MSVSSDIKVKFVFKEYASAVEWFKKLSSMDERIYQYYVNEISFKRIIRFSPDRNKFDKDKFVVYLNSSNRNYFYERYFLSQLLNNIPNSEIDAYAKNHEFGQCFKDINAKYKCAIDYLTTEEYGAQDHIVWDYDGKIILEEKNKIDIETNEHSNPDFNKQNIETLLLK